MSEPPVPSLVGARKVSRPLRAPTRASAVSSTARVVELSFIGPIVIVGVYAFGHAVFGGVVLGFTLENFDQALSGFYLNIFFRTLQFAAVGTALCLVVAMPVAYFLARKVTRFRALLVVLLIIPFWTSFLIRTLAWRTLLAADGPIRDALNFLHLHEGPLARAGYANGSSNWHRLRLLATHGSPALRGV